MARIRKRVAQFVAHKLEALLEVANMHHKRPSRLSDMILREYQQRRANACSTASASRSSVTSLLGGFATPAPQIPDYSTASEADASGATAKFLHLPPELHLEIITILFHTYPTEKPEHYPLKALRLTSRRLSELTTPILFATLSLLELNLPQLDGILAVHDRLKHVRNLSILLPSQDTPQSDSWEIRIIKLIQRTPNINSLTVEHAREDRNRRHPLLLHLVTGLQYLEHVQLREMGFEPHIDMSYSDIPQEDVESTFFHEFLMTILNSHATRLRSLTLHTLLPLHSLALAKLRDHATKLASIKFTTNISLTLRPVFSQPKPWACANTLRHLTLHECGGAHVGSLAHNFIAGVFGNLETLEVVACGDPSDELPAREAFNTASNPPLLTLQADHAAAWELHSLACIPALSVSLTRSPIETILEMTEILEEGAGFGGVAKSVKFLPASVVFGGTEFEKLLRVCDTKGLDRGWDAKSWGSCQCHPDA